MPKIRNIAFDLGGVVLALSYEGAVRSFQSIGLKDARSELDAFQQRGIFGQLEEGSIDAEQFREALSRMVGRTLTSRECFNAWHGYVESVPKRNLQALRLLRSEGYQLCLLSNTNPYMMQWARSDKFDGEGHPVDYYFDRLYLSYECKAMKPSERIFRMMLEGQQALPEETLFIDDGARNVEVASQMGMLTLCPQNNEDWTEPLLTLLRQDA